MLAQSKPLFTLSISFSTSPYSSGHLRIPINYYTVALTTVTSFSHQYSSLFNSWDKLLTIVNKRNELEFEWNHFLHVRLKVSKDSSVKSHLFFFFNENFITTLNPSRLKRFLWTHFQWELPVGVSVNVPWAAADGIIRGCGLRRNFVTRACSQCKLNRRR